MLQSKHFLFITLLSTALLSGEKVYEDSSNYTIKRIMQDGVLQKVSIPNSHYRNSNAARYGIIVKFIDDKRIDIKAFEAQFDLVLQEKLQIGYYIFKNNSSFNDFDLIEKIMQSEKNIHTIKQNRAQKAKLL